MLSEYDYTCPHCNKISNYNGECPPPEAGDIRACRHCHKLGKIVYAKVVYVSKKIEREVNE